MLSSCLSAPRPVNALRQQKVEKMGFESTCIVERGVLPCPALMLVYKEQSPTHL